MAYLSSFYRLRNHRPKPFGKQWADNQLLRESLIFVTAMDEIVDQGNTELWKWALYEKKWHSWLNHTFLQHATIPASTPGFGDTSRKSGQVPAPLDLPTWITRASHLD